MVEVRRDGISITPQWRFRPITSIAHTPFISNNEYTLIDLTSDVYALYLQVYQSNTATDNKTVTVTVTLDGTTISTALTVADKTWQYVYLDDASDELITTLTKTTFLGEGLGLYAQSIKITGRCNSDDPDSFRMKLRWLSL